MKITHVTSAPGEHERMLRDSRAAYANRETAGEQPPVLDEADEAILDRAWARLGAEQANAKQLPEQIDLATASDAELLAYGRAGREADQGDEPPVMEEGDEALLTAAWKQLGRDDGSGRLPADGAADRAPRASEGPGDR